MSLLQAAFSYLAAAIFVGSVLVVTRRNPVHSVLWMLLVFVHIAVLFVFLNADFVAVIQIIVYAGAVLVLFLFVLMLLNLRTADLGQRLQKQWPIGAVLAGALFVVLGTVLSNTRVVAETGTYTVDLMTREGNIAVLGKVLYSEYLLPFEIASLVLLVAILGAVVMAIRKAT